MHGFSWPNKDQLPFGLSANFLTDPHISLASNVGFPVLYLDGPTFPRCPFSLSCLGMLGWLSHDCHVQY